MAAYAINELANILATFQHFPGLPGRARVLRFFGDATLGWAIALVVAAILLSLAGRYFPVDGAALRSRVRMARTAVAAAAAFTALSALVDLITALSAAGTHGGSDARLGYAALGLPIGVDGAITAALAYLAVAVIAAATAVWAYGLSRVQD